MPGFAGVAGRESNGIRNKDNQKAMVKSVIFQAKKAF